MGSRSGCVLILLMVCVSMHANARSSLNLGMNEMSLDQQVPSNYDSKEPATSEEMCALCQEYTNEIVTFFSKNETQSEIISTLHVACSFTHVFKHECIKLVDHYLPLFLMEITMVQPEQFCGKVQLCEGMASVHLQRRDDPCKLCRRVVGEVLAKLQDPDTQLEIIEILLKGCNQVENFVQECKKLVFEYGPIILANAEKFLETKDVCAAIHLCKAAKNPTSFAEVLRASA